MASYGGGGDAARQQVSGPATALLVCAIINFVLITLGLVANLTGIGQPAPQPGVKAEDAQMMSVMSGTMGVFFNLLGLGANVVVLMAAQKMKALQSYGLVMAGSILALIPCLSCCLTGIPIGIWSLVVINKAEVKSAFTS